MTTSRLSKLDTGDELAAYRSPSIARRRGIVAAVATLALLLGAGIPLTVAAVYGDGGYDSIALSYPGLLTSLVATAVHVVATLSAWLLLGSLLTALLLTAHPGRDRDVVFGQPELRWAKVSAGVWMGTSGALVLIDAADKNGQPLIRLLEPGAPAYLVDASYFPKAWVVTFLLATVALLVLLLAETWRGLLVPLWCAVIGSLAPVVVGQILVGPAHDFGSDAGSVQFVALGALCGTIWVLSMRLARGHLLRPESLRRSWMLLSAMWSVVAAAELVLIPFKLNGPGDGNPTWMLLFGRALAIALLGVVLAALWLGLRRLTDKRITRAAGASSVLAATVLGLSMAMERVPPPQYFAPSSIMTIFFGFDLTEAPTVDVLLTTWRPNLLFVAIGVAAVTTYLLAVRRLRRRGDAWPSGRTVAWVAGWVTVVVATSSGFGVYSGSDFGIHMIVHMALNMLAPVLLVMGGVVTLLLRACPPRRPQEAAGPHEWLTWLLNWRVLHVLYNPIIVFVLFIGSYYGLYLTGLFEQVIRFHWAHQAMNIHFLIVGYLFYSIIIGVDRPPHPLPPIGKLGFVLAAMPFHAFFGVILMMATTPIAENFYLTLGAPWSPDLALAQYIGGGVAWAGGELPLILVIVALGVQWARQDNREAARKDRHLDAGLDDEFDDYNRMLEQLARRDQRAHSETGARP